jgi:hypothetical protein
MTVLPLILFLLLSVFGTAFADGTHGDHHASTFIGQTPRE